MRIRLWRWDLPAGVIVLLIALFLTAATAWMLFFSLKYKQATLMWTEGTSTITLFVVEPVPEKASRSHWFSVSLLGGFKHQVHDGTNTPPAQFPQ